MLQKSVDEIRAFNRFYTNILGLLDAHILNSRYSLPEARIMFELYLHKQLTASEIITLLRIDKGYLSRLLKQFVQKKLVSIKPSNEDGRLYYISLSSYGTREFEKLNAASGQQVTSILSELTKDEVDKLVSHMNAIKTILQKANL